MTERGDVSWWRQWTQIGEPSPLPVGAPQTALDHALDRYVALTAPFLRGCWVFLVVGLVVWISFRLGPVAGLALTAAYLTIHGTACLATFLRCREAHCLVTGIGWSVLAIVAFGGAVAGHDIRGAVWNTFLAVTIVGFALELVWHRTRGSSALRLR